MADFRLQISDCRFQRGVPSPSHHPSRGNPEDGRFQIADFKGEYQVLHTIRAAGTRRMADFRLQISKGSTKSFTPSEPREPGGWQISDCRFQRGVPSPSHHPSRGNPEDGRFQIADFKGEYQVLHTIRAAGTRRMADFRLQISKGSTKSFTPS